MSSKADMASQQLTLNFSICMKRAAQKTFAGFESEKEEPNLRSIYGEKTRITISMRCSNIGSVSLLF